MYFSPSNNIVKVKTYSPWTDEYETDADSQFSFSYNMQLPGGSGSPGTAYAALGTNSNVTPGSQSSLTWAGLQANKTYEWYAKVTDSSRISVISPVRRFTTTVNSAPVASNQTVTVIGDRPTQLTLLASDSNGDALTFRTNSLPLRGFNLNFDATNGTMTYLPAHGYRGLDRFTYQANDGFNDSQVATFNLIVSASPDTNSNGLPDAWEAKYGIGNPNADDDGDGQSNLAEYLANTNPTNATSHFEILSAGWDLNGYFKLTWSSIGGTRYRVQYLDGDASGGISGTFTDVARGVDSEMDSSPYGTASTQTFTDDFTFTGAPTNGARYYRVKVMP
jgi:hypothetical protein